MKQGLQFQPDRLLLLSSLAICAAFAAGIMLYADGARQPAAVDEPSDSSASPFIDDLIRLGINAKYAQQLDECKQHYRKALNLAAARKQWDSVSIVYSLLASGSFAIIRDDSVAYDLLDSAFYLAAENVDDPHIPLAYAYRTIGEIHQFYTRHDSAIAYFNRSIEAASTVNPNEAIVFSCYHLLSRIYGQTGDFAAYLQALEECLSLGVYLLGEKSMVNASTLNQLAKGYTAVRNYGRAQRYFERALALNREICGENHITVAWTYVASSALLHARGAYEEEIALLKRSLPILIASSGEHHFSVADCRAKLAAAYFKTGDYRMAADYARKARADLAPISHAKISERPGIELENLIILSGCHVKQRNFEQAEACLTEGQTLVKNYNMGVAYQVKLLCARGELHRARREFGKSLQYYQQALTVCVGDFQDPDINSNPDIRRSVWDPYLLHALLGKFETLDLLGRSNAEDSVSHDLALSTFHLAVQLVARIEREYLDENWKYLWMSEARPQFDRALRIAYQLYQSSQESRYLDFALNVSQQSKSVVYRARFNESKAKLANPVLDSLLQIESDIKLELATLRHKLASAGDPSDTTDPLLASLRERVFSKWTELEAFAQLMEEQYSHYQYSRNESEQTTSRSLQQALPSDGNTIVDYYRGADFVQLIALSSSESSLLHVPIDSTFAVQVEELRDAIVRKDYLDFIRPAYSLYRLLMAPLGLRPDGRNVTIIPDAEIGLIPFDCLISEAADPAVADYRKLSYLMRDYCIQYDFSIALLANSAQRQRQYRAKQGAYIGFAPEFSGSLIY